ncbi:YecR family lipoprotein [Lysobacter sp. A289]
MKQSVAFFISGITLLCLGGCATASKEWLVTGASRSDGVVTLSYENNKSEVPVVDRHLANDIATQKCTAWDYKSAEAFGTQQQICLVRRGFGNCVKWRITVPYQCTGSPSH